MANKIQLKRGTKAQLPTLSPAEPGYCTDTKELFIGNATGGNTKLISAGELVFHAKDYGAVANGTKDDTGAINSAVSACQAAGGGIVLLCKGTHLLSGTITIPSNVHVTGHGKGATKVFWKNAAGDLPIFAIGPDISNAGISDLTIDGNKANQTVGSYAIRCHMSHDCRFERIDVLNQKFISFGFSDCYRFTVRDCQSMDGDHMGFWFFVDNNVAPWNTGENYIENVAAYRQGLDGILIETPNSWIRDSRFIGNGVGTNPGALGAAGIYTDILVKNLKITGCYVANNSEYGINVVADGAIIEDNTIENNALSGICLRTHDTDVSRRCVIANNVIRNNGNSGTTVTAYSKSGISLDKSSDITISGNIICDDRTTKTQRFGVEAFDQQGASSRIVLTGNILNYNLVDSTNLSDKGRPRAEVGNDTPSVNSFSSAVYATIGSTSQSITANNQTKVIFKNVKVNQNNEYNATTGVFKAMRTGGYLVNSAISWNGVTAPYRVLLDVFVNGVLKARLDDKTIGGTASVESTSEGCAVVDLSAGDELDIRAFTSVNNQALNNVTTRLSVTQMW